MTDFYTGLATTFAVIAIVEFLRFMEKRLPGMIFTPECLFHMYCL